MKKFRSTIILIILGACLWGYLKYFDDRFAGTEDTPRTTAIDRSQIESFSIKNGEGTIEFKQNDTVWTIETPVKDRADEGAIATLFTTLEGLDMNLRKVKEAKGKDARELHKELGVAKGEVSIKLSGKKPLELLIGKETAVKGKVYARIEGADATYVLPTELLTILSKGVKDWRDRKLTSISAGEVKKVILKTAKGELEAERKNGNWSLVRPLKARADNQKLIDLISNSTAPRIEDFVSDSKDLASFGLTEPQATLTFHTEGGKEPVIVQIGATKAEKKDPEKKDSAGPEKTFTYVKVSTREGVVTVPSSIEKLALTQPNDLRDSSLVRVQQDIVDRITIEGPGGKIVLGRDGEDWKRKIAGKPDEPVNSAAANKLLNDLTNAKTVRFVEDVASDLKKYGLDRPSATVSVTLSSYSTEGTPETSPGDKPISRIMFGKTEEETVFAKLDDEPYIVAVAKSLVDGIWSDPLEWQDLKIYDLNQNDIVRLELARIDQPAVTLELGPDKMWKLVKGDGVVNQIAVQSLINTLHSLRAVRWAGATKPAEQGLDKPAITLSFSMADKKTGKLKIGSMNSDRLRHGTADGKTGTFLLNRPDTSAFEAALIEGQKPANPTPANAPALPDATPADAASPAVTPPAAAVVPPAPIPLDPAKLPEPPKAQEAPAGETKPAPEPAPK